jgi:hypothetical protein
MLPRSRAASYGRDSSLRSPKRIDKERDIGLNEHAEGARKDELLVTSSASAANLKPHHQKGYEAE